MESPFESPVVWLMLLGLAALALLTAGCAGLLCLPKIKAKTSCGACGYSRAGLADRPTCPECGHIHGRFEPSYSAYVAAPRQRLWLSLTPPAISMVATASYMFAVFGTSLAPDFIVVMIAALPPVLPTLVFPLAASGRTTRKSVWIVTCFTGIAGAAAFVVLFLWNRPTAYFGDIEAAAIACMCGLVTSMFTTGIAACALALVAHRAARRLPSPKGSE